MKKNIAVVGCGHWGKNLVRNFSELGSLSAVCDPDIELAKSYADKHDVRVLSFEEITSDKSIHGVVLAVPAPLHATMAIEAMKAGKHVYVEKPLAMNEKEAIEMLLIAKEYDVRLMVGHLLQYHPIFVAIRKLVKDNKLGKLSYMYSNRLSLGKVRSEEDVIWSFAPHDISMILSLTGEVPITVRTDTSKILQPNIADTATIHMEFKQGLKAHISVSWLHPYKEQKLVVVGKDAMIIFDDTKSWNEKLAFYPHSVSYTDGMPVLQKADVEYLKVDESEPLKNECQHFIDIINEDILPITDGFEGLKVLKVLSAASLSEKETKTIGLEKV
jgi:UDP-2-acetamido-3-amino-2,3-dideoxy-glucuronate N-acetyltransferase